MKTKLILIALITAGLSSCSTAYKMQQTPDDVYYSPAPPQDLYVQVNNEEDRNVYNNSSSEDREILRRVNNRRWRKRNYDYGYSYPYPYGYYPYSYYPYGNNYPVYVDPETGTSPSTYKGARKYNLGTYKPPITTDGNTKTGKIITEPNGSPVRIFSRPPANKGTGAGNFIRRVFSSPGISSNTYNNSDNTTQTRTFEPSRNSSVSSPASTPRSSSTGSSGSNAPVRSFRK
jgi:hypothetical protein